MPRKPMAERGTQTSLRLPQALHARLMEAAGDRGIGEEIRRRLEASFEQEPIGDDPKTRGLTAALATAAARLRAVYGKAWDGDAFAFAAFRKAAHELVDMHVQPAPDGEPEFRPAEGSVYARMQGATSTVEQMAVELCVSTML